ncbi:MAG: hypothetical protein ACK5O3_10160 [Burkholderiales bacterium]
MDLDLMDINNDTLGHFTCAAHLATGEVARTIGSLGGSATYEGDEEKRKNGSHKLLLEMVGADFRGTS